MVNSTIQLLLQCVFQNYTYLNYTQRTT